LPKSGGRALNKRAFWFFGLAALVFVVDQLAKLAAISNLEVGRTQSFIGDLVRFTLAYNDSAAFSIGFGVTWIFAITSSIAAIALIWVFKKIQTTGWAIMGGILLGGITGNLLDRFTQATYFGSGKVVDFIAIPFNFPIFNIADMAICTIISLTLIRLLRGEQIGKALKESQGANG
jgi:signal peptidase II